MSAITGIFMRNGKDVDPELMKKMNEKLSHRGPDGSAIWCDGPMGLGHQMLWTTQESLNEKLPLEENNLVITADARIDNRDELSKELGLRDEEDVSDSYFILKAYEKWGEDCPDKLLGDFAFAIWDKKEEKLFCARDHMGVKPFYYYLDEDMFVFGTEIKALFCVNGVPREINELKIGLYLMQDILDKEMTFYNEIKSLISANYLKVNVSKKYIKKYWELDSEKEIIMDNDDEYAQAFLEIFTESIKCRLRSYSPIGFSLSGGLDSSSIVCTAQKIYDEININSKKIDSFSFIFNEISECDERYYIQKVVEKNNIEPHYVNCDFINPIDEIYNILWHQDQPFYTPNLGMHNNLYKKVHSSKIKVLLTGEGGDEVVSYGDNYLKELFRKLSWKKLIKEINGESIIRKKNKFRILFLKTIYPLFPNYLKKKINLFRNKSQWEFIDANFLIKADLNYEKFVEKNNELGNLNSKEFHYHNIKNYPQFIFEIIDHECGAFSIESRHPFFDKRLIEFCYGIPTDIKLRLGWNRYILRIAMNNILPNEIQWREDKTDLSPVYKKNLFLFNKDKIEKIISNKNINIKNFININHLEHIYKNKPANYERIIWLTILISFWLKYTETLFKK